MASWTWVGLAHWFDGFARKVEPDPGRGPERDRGDQSPRVVMARLEFQTSIRRPASFLGKPSRFKDVQREHAARNAFGMLPFLTACMLY